MIGGLLTARRLDRWTAVFLTTTVATSVTAFMFPISHLTPGLVLAILSLVVLGVTIVARYPQRLAGPWRWVYALGAVLAQYFNVFVLIVQLFQKVPALHELAPTQSEPPFQVTQLVCLVAFALLAVFSAIRFRPLVA